MKQLTLGSLFAGIGGFELAATWAGIQPAWSNEIDSFACKVLNKNFDHEIIQKDIKEIGRKDLRSVDIISGGFPCQPFSQAGKRKGKSDDRYLWPEMLRIIRELNPSWVVGENVAGLLSMENGETLKRILSDLENERYNNEIFIIPAASLGAWHRRDRIWIVSNSLHNGNEQLEESTRQCTNESKFKKQESRTQHPEQFNKLHKSGKSEGKNVSNTSGQRLQRTKQCQNHDEEIEGRQASSARPTSECGGNAGRYWSTEPKMGRVANGIPNRVDRLKGLGNAIVPQVAYEIFKAIADVELLRIQE